MHKLGSHPRGSGERNRSWRVGTKTQTRVSTPNNPGINKNEETHPLRSLIRWMYVLQLSFKLYTMRRWVGLFTTDTLHVSLNLIIFFIRKSRVGLVQKSTQLAGGKENIWHGSAQDWEPSPCEFSRDRCYVVLVPKTFPYFSSLGVGLSEQPRRPRDG